MRTIDASHQAAVNAGRVVTRAAVLFVLGSGSYGFWSGEGPWTFNTVTYIGAGKLISGRLSVPQSIDGQARFLDLKLSSVPNSDLTPDVLASIEAESYKNRPMRLYEVIFDADTRAQITVRIRFAGQISNIEHEYSVGGGYTLTAHCASRSIDHQRIGFAMRTQEQQLQIDPDDTGSLEYVATVGTEVIPWGRDPSTASQEGGGRRGNKSVFG